MAKRLAPLPRVTTKTITVGALLGKIKRLIISEPKRLDMGVYVGAFQGRTVHGFAAQDKPACGTVGCMAGWGAVMLRPDGVSGRKLDKRAEDAMTRALGFDYPDCYDDMVRTVGGLFDPEVVTDLDGEDAWGCDWPMPGTPEHAAVIAKRIDTYLSQHPEIVKRKIVVADVQKALRA